MNSAAAKFLSRVTLTMFMLSILGVTSIAHAAGIKDGRIKVDECNALGINCDPGDGFIDIGSKGISYILAALTLASVVAFGALIFGAFLYITSRGDESQSQKAKLTIIYALAGLAILGIAGALINATINLF